MQSAMFIGCLLLAALVTPASAVTPIQKVLGMMEELKAKAQKEKQDEIDTFNEFTKFCRETIRAKGYAIKDAAKDMEALKADVQKNDADAMVLGEEIRAHDSSIDTHEHEKAEETEVRDKDNMDYQKTLQDYITEIDELEVGITELKKMQAKTSAAAGAALIQKMASHPRTATTRRVLTSFLESGSKREAIAMGQPADPAFENQSDGIVDMMVDLKDKLVEEKTDLETEEMNKQHAFTMVVQALDNNIKKNTEKRTEKASTKKSKEVASAQASGELASTTNTKAEDEKYTAELTTLCEQKSADFEIRQKTRAEELVAIDKAMEIIGGESVAGKGAKHLPSLAQRRGGASSLAQLRLVTDAKKPSQHAVASFLALQSRELNSRILAAVSQRAAADPFVKVRKMIEDMINKLMDEASEEAEHKGFCDEELSTNQATRDEKTSMVAELTATAEEKTAQSAKLASEISTLESEIKEIDAAVSEATEIRNAEHEKNTATVADAKEAIDAVSRATKVLKDFYEKAAGATALVQQRQRGPADDVPETFGDEPFTGSGGEGGVLGMLEVILSDFERLESETSSSEAEAKKEYDTLMTESAEDKESKHQDTVSKGRTRNTVEHELKLTKKELKQTEAQLEAANEYYEKLKPSCVDAGVSYEDRVAQRKQEIESLKEALKILEEA